MESGPPFRAEQVGSLLRSAYLLGARAAHARGQLSANQLRELEDRAIAEAVRMQEAVGLQSVTDGELRRENFFADFFGRGLGAASVFEEPERVYFVDDLGRKIPAPINRLQARVAWREPIHVGDFEFLRRLTARTPKVTLPSPTLLHFNSSPRAVAALYPELELMWAELAAAYRKELAALAAAGCGYVQLDEVALAVLCDPSLRQALERAGREPQALIAARYPDLINRALAGRPAGMHVAMHLCRGNNQSGWLASGGYEAVADIIFNRIEVDSYFLEFDSPRAGGFEPLRLVPKGKRVVLGLISSKLPALEDKDRLKRRLELAARYLDLDQLGLSPQCGFASTAPGNRLTMAEQEAKLRLVVEVAREVWG